MGVRIAIGGTIVEAVSYEVSEASSPLSSADTTGQVGTISFAVPHLDDSHLLIDESVYLADSRKGFTLGKILSINPTQDSNLDQITCVSRLGELNVYGVQAQPFVGTLRAAFLYYLGLASVETDLLVDDAIGNRQVVFPGWNGELWFYLKQMAAAQACDLSLVSGVIILRPIRQRVAVQDQDITRSFVSGGGSLAQAVEVYQYNNRAITDEMVYPPGGWSSEVQIINVNSGETIEQNLELSASVTSVIQPTMQVFVAKNFNSASVYAVAGDDGLPITPAAWSARGGSLSVSINPDTTSLTVKVTAPTGLPNTQGQEISVYSIALASDASGSRYSTLRLVGSGVGFDKQKLRIRTGIPPERTGTDVGVTIDNPFLSTADDAYSAGVRAAKTFTGATMSLSGSLAALNPRGDSGNAKYPKYSEVQSAKSGMTYAQVAVSEHYAGETYSAIQDYWESTTANDYENQVFGNLAGSRVWDKRSARWYRIRSGRIGPDSNSFDADDDLTHSDFQGYYSGMTYAAVDTKNFSLTYTKQDLRGLKKSPNGPLPPLPPFLPIYPDIWYPDQVYPAYDL
jgi:hypothetical protein